MKKILLLVCALAFSSVVYAMDRENLQRVVAEVQIVKQVMLEQQLSAEIKDRFPASYVCCGLIKARITIDAYLCPPPAIFALGEAYKADLAKLGEAADSAKLNVIIAGLRHVQNIINRETNHVRGPYADVSRSEWMCTILEEVCDQDIGRSEPRSPHAQTILPRFPHHVRKSQGRYYISRKHHSTYSGPLSRTDIIRFGKNNDE